MLDWGGSCVLLGVPKLGTEASFVVQHACTTTSRSWAAATASPARTTTSRCSSSCTRPAGSSSTSWCRPTYPLERRPAGARRHARRQAQPRRPHVRLSQASDRAPARRPRGHPRQGLELGPLGRRRPARHRRTCSTPEAARRGAAAVRSGPALLAGARPRPERPAGRPAAAADERRSSRSPRSTSATRHAPGMWAGTDDMVTMSTCAGTHIDASAHVTYDGLMYNGFPASNVTASARRDRRAAPRRCRTIVTRGVLLDVAAREGRRRAGRDRSRLRDHRRRPRRRGATVRG